MDTNNKNADFYRAFEDKFRGSHDEIRARLEIYNPFLEAIRPHSRAGLCLDLGCGRGEWLELLRDKGFTAHGVDLDERMLAASRERNLDVRRMDAIEAVSSAQNDTLAIVSGFHIAEHLPFAKLQVLVSEALRALLPGGLLILETPNPENLKVSSHTFHLDPTHQKPLPPALLQFMTEYYGFARSKIVRLQEQPFISQSPLTTVEDVIFGVSPDYAIVAQKSAPPDILAGADAVFSRTFGVSDRTLMQRFEESYYQLRNTVEVEQAARIAQEQTINLMLNSISWKITAPLRSAARGFGRLASSTRTRLEFRPDSRIRRAMQFLLTHAMLWVRNRPRLARVILKGLQLSPTLQRRLISAAQARGMALSFHSTHMPAWHIDIEPEVIEKWEKLRR